MVYKILHLPSAKYVLTLTRMDFKPFAEDHLKHFKYYVEGHDFVLLRSKSYDSGHQLIQRHEFEIVEVSD